MPHIKDKTAQEIMDEAVKCGIVFELDAHSENVTIKAAVNPPPWLRAWLKKHRAEIAEILRQEVFAEAAPPRAPEPIHPREALRDREIANALKALLALAEHGVTVVPIWCPYYILGVPWESLTFTAGSGPWPKDRIKAAHQNTRGICALLRRAWSTPRPPGYSVDTFLSHPSPLWLAAVAEADFSGQPPGLAQ